MLLRTRSGIRRCRLQRDDRRGNVRRLLDELPTGCPVFRYLFSHFFPPRKIQQTECRPTTQTTHLPLPPANGPADSTPAICPQSRIRHSTPLVPLRQISAQAISQSQRGQAPAPSSPR